MWNIIRGELAKMRRCQILLVGIVALALCPVVQYGNQLIVEPEYRELNYDFTCLFANVIWGNTQIFLPISLVMIGGWLIDRESVSDTLKNIVTVPVAMPCLLAAKLIVTGILAVLFGIYSVGATLITGTLVGLPGLTPQLALGSGFQVAAAALTVYLVCMPMILIFGRIRGAYLGGSILTFFLGYSMLFFKSGLLLSAYPFSAALILVGFDMTKYNGATSPTNVSLALMGICSILIITIVLLINSGNYGEALARRTKKAKGGRRKNGRH